MICNIAGEDSSAVIAMLFLLVPASLYAMGLMEGRAGRYLFGSAIAVHLFGMIQRGVILGMVPFTEKHDTISFMAFALAFAFAVTITASTFKKYL